jgi:cobalt-zinc-cadmium efflux system outer membrane protein
VTLVLFAVACLSAGPPACAWQQGSDDGRARGRILEIPNLGPIPGATTPSLGPGPGAFDDAAAPSTQVIGGRKRSSILPRDRAAGALARGTAARGMSLPEPLPAPAARATGLALGTSALDRRLADDPGPAAGLSYDAALDRMMGSNLDIRALRHELPQADADILTAGLRTNPLLYVDSQFIPYRAFGSDNPGGPTQYDVNLTLPLDVSGKRRSRTVVARVARSALEAQFQDVVRRQIDNVARAWVGLQATRIDLLAAEASLRQQEALAVEAERIAGGERPNAAARRRLAREIERTRALVADAREAFEDAQETLAVLLDIPPAETAALVPSGSLRVEAPAAPELDELLRLAVGCRPDLRAVRLGVERARAEVDLQRAARFDDVYLFYDPFTAQDLRPYGHGTATSWAVGLTFSVPLFNRNQGNVARAESNVGQSRTEAAAVERRVAAEVRLAEREYRYAREALERIDEVVFPEAEAALEQAEADFAAGTIGLEDLRDELEEAAVVARARREALVRFRRAMLDLNTAVGMRILP